MDDRWKLYDKVHPVLPPIGYKPSPAEKEGGIGLIVHSEDFTHVFWEQKKLDFGETVLDRFWISDGPWILKAKARVFNKDQFWTDPILVLRAEATDSSSEAMANGGAGLNKTWEGGCELHTQSQAIMFVTCSVRCLIGTGLISEVQLWAYRPQ